jgi:hypothetical protein
LIATSSSLLILTSVPWVLGINLFYYTRVDTVTKLTQTLYYSFIFLVIGLAISFVVAIVFLASLGYQSELAPVIVVVSIFRILWSALLSYCYLKARKAAINCKV